MRQLFKDKTYGGLTVIDLLPGSHLVEVRCEKCGYVLKKLKDEVRTGLLKSCGGFGCRERSKLYNEGKNK